MKIRLPSKRSHEIALQARFSAIFAIACEAISPMLKA